MKIQEIAVILAGLSDIMFDRFIDHSKEKRPPEQKLYLAAENMLVMPKDNIEALLFGDDPPGCARCLEGKAGKNYLRMGLSHVFVKESLIPFQDEAGASLKFDGFGEHLWIHRGAPRTKQGSRSIKQEMKERPVLRLPWNLSFHLTILENVLINENKVYNWLVAGGMQIGLGTYRPRFGRFEVRDWKVL